MPCQNGKADDEVSTVDSDLDHMSTDPNDNDDNVAWRPAARGIPEVEEELTATMVSGGFLIQFNTKSCQMT